jgi:hypothetical protein
MVSIPPLGDVYGSLPTDGNDEVRTATPPDGGITRPPEAAGQPDAGQSGYILPPPNLAASVGDLTLHELLERFSSDLSAMIRLIGGQAMRETLDGAIADVQARSRERINFLSEQISTLADIFKNMPAGSAMKVATGGLTTNLLGLEGTTFASGMFAKMLQKMGVDEEMANFMGMTMAGVLLVLSGAAGEPAVGAVFDLSNPAKAIKAMSAAVQAALTEAGLEEKEIETLMDKFQEMTEQEDFLEAFTEELRALVAMMDKILKDIGGAAPFLEGEAAVPETPGVQA